MKITSLLEILLILIIIAFAASKPVDTESRAIKNVKKQVIVTKQEPAPVIIQPVVPSTTPAEDDAVDDLLGLVVGDDDDDDDDEEEVEEEDDDDDVDLLGLGDDDDDDEPEGESAADPADEDVDGDDFALLGDDLFDGIFEDETTTKKPKVKPTAAAVAPVEIQAAQIPVKPIVPVTDAKKPIASAAASVATADKPIIVPSSGIKDQPSVSDAGQKIALNLQHTPALLQLSQSNSPNRIPNVKTKPNLKPTDNTIVIGLTPEQSVPEKVVVVKIPNSANSPIEMHDMTIKDQLMEADNDLKVQDNIVEKDESNPNTGNDSSLDESGEDENMIIISSSEMQSQTEDSPLINEVHSDEIVENEKTDDDEVSVEQEIVDENSTIPKDKVQDVPVAENVDSLEAAASASTAPVTKKPPKKEEQGLLGGIVSALIDDDDDDEDEKPDANKGETGDKEESSEEADEEEEEEEDEEESAEEEDGDDDEEENDNKKKKKKGTAAGAAADGADAQNSNKKKKNEGLTFTSIGETLGLARIFGARHL